MNKRRIIWELIELIMRLIAILFSVSLFVVFCGAMGLKMGGPIAAAIAGFLALAVMVTGIVVIFKQHKENEVTEENKAKAENRQEIPVGHHVQVLPLRQARPQPAQVQAVLSGVLL